MSDFAEGVATMVNEYERWRAKGLSAEAVGGVARIRFEGRVIATAAQVDDERFVVVREVEKSHPNEFDTWGGYEYDNESSAQMSVAGVCDDVCYEIRLRS